MIKIASLTFNPFGQNTYILSTETGETIIVDAGCYCEAEHSTLKAYIEKNSLRPVLALNTHAHIDHVCGVEWVKEKFAIPFALHEDDQPILAATADYGEALGFKTTKTPTVDRTITDNETIAIGNDSIRIIHTPGHTAGGVSIYIESQKMLITGDTLFRESIGRTDLPTGDYPTLMRSIVERIIPLGPDVKIFPGHGPASDILHETKRNPFVSEVLNGDFSYEN